jgi:hypothetical protein
MRKSLLAAIGVLALGTVPWQEIAGQDKLATLAQDRKKLAEGLWRTDDWRKEGATGWQCHAGVSLQALDFPRLSLTINFERGNQSTSGPVLGTLTEIKEKGDKRWIAIEPKEAKRNDLPPEIYYRFDGDTLVLKLETGLCKGEYKLKREKKK